MCKEPVAHVRGNDEEQSLVAHIEEVAALAARFAKPARLPYTAELLGLVHDLGKAAAVFQCYLLSATGRLDQDSDDFVDAQGLKGKIDHSTAGAQWCLRELPPTTGKVIDSLCRQLIAQCLCSHHSGLIDCLALDGSQVFAARMNKPDDKTHLTEALSTLGRKFVDRMSNLFAKKVLPELRQRVFDLINSSSFAAGNPTLLESAGTHSFCTKCPRHSIPECRVTNPLWHFSVGLLTRFLFSCLLDADRTNSADFEHPRNTAARSGGIPDWQCLIARLEEHLTGFRQKADGLPAVGAASTINIIRNDISARCLARAQDPNGIYTLTVPTGGGKTLAALRFALHHASHNKMARVIHVIPYTSIIDQNARVAREILEPDEPFGTVVLEQHSNIEPELETWQGRLLAENWDAPVVYTTMVQFLECLFGGGTRGARRMHRLANAVIVFDEIQTLPVNCVHMFCNAVNFLVRECKTTVVLCTATQPLLGRLRNSHLGALRIGPECEMMPDVEDLYATLKRVKIANRIRPEGWGVGDVAELAMQECRRTGSCLVVVNTKRWARILYEECQRDGAEGLYHLSTNLCPAHRMVQLDAIRESLDHNHRFPEDRQPVLCISTQLIEAGVDVDFASAIRFVAGLDSVLQAAGRCNRNGLAACGVVHLINPRDEDLSMLRDIKEGREQTLRVIGEFERDEEFDGDLLHPDVINRYFEYYFFNRAGEMAYPVSADRAGRDDTLLNILSCNPRNGGRMGTAPAMRQSFASAGRLFAVIDAPTHGIIVPYGEGRRIIGQLCGESYPAKLRHLLRHAQRYTVNVYPNTMRELIDRHAVHEIQKGTGIYYLVDGHYDDSFGLSTEKIGVVGAYFA